MIEKELRELTSSNQANYTKICQGLYRALEERKERITDSSFVTLNAHPTLGNQSHNQCNYIKHQINSIIKNITNINFKKAKSVNTDNELDGDRFGDSEKNKALLERQLRTLSRGNIYNELKRPAGENI